MRRLMAVSLLVALAATACGKGAGNQVSFVSDAAARSEAATTVRLSLTVTGTLPNGTIRTFHGDGELDRVHKLFEIHFALPGLPEVGTVNVDMIASPSGVYVHLPAAVMSRLGQPDKWLFMTNSELGKNRVGIPKVDDPTKAFDAIKSVASSVSFLGKAKVRGFDTREYAVKLDQAKLLARAPAGTQGSAAASIPQDMRVYVGTDDGLIHRMDFHVSRDGHIMKYSAETYDYGNGPAIKLPSSGQVIDANKVIPNPSV